jgi:hypothetical protein
MELVVRRQLGARRDPSGRSGAADHVLLPGFSGFSDESADDLVEGLGLAGLVVESGAAADQGTADSGKQSPLGASCTPTTVNRLRLPGEKYLDRHRPTLLRDRLNKPHRSAFCRDLGVACAPVKKSSASGEVRDAGLEEFQRRARGRSSLTALPA